jgi:uncharacterized protein (UPF0332 family)
MTSQDSLFLEKAQESINGADSEFGNRRYNNCANRCYYACFQAAIAALEHAGIQTTTRNGQWGHDYVQAQFAGQLIGRRKLYGAAFRTTLERAYKLRATADYGKYDRVSRTQAERSLARARDFVATVSEGGDTQ